MPGPGECTSKRQPEPPSRALHADKSDLANPVMKPSRLAAGPGVGYRRIDRDLAGVGAEVQRRLVTFSVVQGEVRDGAVGRQVVAVAGMPVAIREREVGACDLDADPVASREVVRGGDADDPDPVDLAGHEPGWLLEAVPVAEPQATVGEVVGGPVRINVHELDEDIRVLDVG